MTQTEPKEPEAVSQPDALAELIQRLEKARGPDRELDAAIMQAEINRAVGFHVPLLDEVLANPSPYTASIDAALTLVPANYHWSITRGADDIGTPEGQEENYSAWCWPEPFSFQERVWHKSPAIALCIAALKAREQR